MIKRLENRKCGSRVERRMTFISNLDINKYSLKLINSINEGFHIAVHIYNSLLPQKILKKITGKTEIVRGYWIIAKQHPSGSQLYLPGHQPFSYTQGLCALPFTLQNLYYWDSIRQ